MLVDETLQRVEVAATDRRNDPMATSAVVIGGSLVRLSFLALNDVEMIRVGRLSGFGDSELTVAFLEQITAPAVGREVPHHTPCPGLRVVMEDDGRPVLPDANERFLNEILRVLLTTGEQNASPTKRRA